LHHFVLSTCCFLRPASLRASVISSNSLVTTTQYFVFPEYIFHLYVPIKLFLNWSNGRSTFNCCWLY